MLEYGAGGSTTLFSRFTKKWVSIEHNGWYMRRNSACFLTFSLRRWGEKVNEILMEQGLESKAKVFTVPNDLPYSNQKKDGDGTEATFHSYINFPKILKEKFDLIIDDGRARVPVSKAALKNQLFRSSSSLMIIHDWEREMYKPIVSQLGYKVVKKDSVSERHLAVLQPPARYPE